MLDFILNPTYWNWLAMGALLLLLEVLGAGGYLLWAGLGAVSVGVVTLFFRVIGFSCCFRQSPALKHIGIIFGFTCCYNETSSHIGERHGTAE